MSGDVFPHRPDTAVSPTNQPRPAGSARATLVECLLVADQRNPNARIQFVDAGPLSYAEVVDRGVLAAARLRSHGITAADRVALYVDNCVSFLDHFVGALLIGAIPVPLNTAYKGEVLAHAVNLTAPRAIVTCGHVDHAPLAVGSPVLLDEVIATPAEHLFPDAVRDMRQNTGMHGLDTAWLAMTSGTTGRSKAIACSHSSTLKYSEIAAWSLGYSAEDVLYTCLPLFHSNALVTTFFGGAIPGANVVIDDRFSVSRYWARVTETGATFTNLIGSMTALLLKAPPSDLERRHRLRQVLRSGSPDLIAQFEERFGVATTEMYGLTDAGLAIATPPGQARPMSCGPVAPGYEARLVSADGATVKGAGRGELYVRQKSSGVLPIGYWRGPGDIQPQVDRDGWFATGDDMARDDDGWYYFRGRIKDVIRRSGENISAADVQAVLEQHPAVHEACAFAVPGELAEDELMVAIELVPGRAASAAELRTFAEQMLPYFAVPRYFRFVPTLPRNETMKVTTLALRAAGVTSDTVDTGGTSRREFERRTGERATDQTSGTGRP